MTVERGYLAEFWPLVDVAQLKLQPGDVVLFRSDWLVENIGFRRFFFERWEAVFPGVECVAYVGNTAPDNIIVKRAMPEMRAEDLYQPERKGTMEA